MATGSFAPQPGNPAAYDWHAYYGGTGGLNEQGTPYGHGHIHIQNGVVQANRMPAERALGQLAVNGGLHP
jgi:hypothetical protein